uniref:Reverse transcriptase domain-containing protein n=1 Tax=Tanacetum cinerariifolium TaxID=118510 RepID=A0A6L2M515_TANCI|nr:reverse transcriptase domain-containing protein [Tanacetum cinerariifolium]
MSTHSLARNLFPPLDNPELTIRRRSRADPTLLNDFEMAAEGNGDPSVPDLRTMEELCQPSLNDTFYNGLTLRYRDTINDAAGGTFLKRSLEECNDLIKNMTAHHNDWDTSAKRTTVDQTLNVYAARAYQAPVYQAPVHQFEIPQPQVMTTNEFTNFMKANDANLKNMQTNMTSLTNINLKLKNLFGQLMKMKTASSSRSGTLPGNTITKPKEELKGITTRSGTAYQGPTIPTTSSSLPLVVERETEATKDTVSCQKLGDPGKFLIPCDFLEMAECLALADLNASINLMPLSVWNKLPIPDLSPTYMTLELADCSISHFDADPRVPLILRRSFLKTERALIDVFEGELTLRVGKEAITFNLNQTSRYSANYNDMIAKQIDVIDMDCEEYSQEVLGFSDVITSGNPTPYYDPIVSTTSLTLTPLGESDFLLEEVNAFLALENDPTSPKVDQSYVNTEGDIILLEAFLNNDPSLPLPNQENYLPQVRKELKIYEAKSDKSSIDEPVEVEIKDLPPHLEYVFLEADDKFPVIIAKYLSVEEKTALITVLKSDKRAIAWKLSDIKGIDPKFCTHKILMEDDFELAVQHQRRVNPKIHDVIKNVVLKLLDTGLIYPISDSPWIKKRPHSLVRTKCLPTIACLLGYAMHWARFREKMLKRCEDTNLFLNWEKSHFMVKEGIVLGHKISKNGIEVDKAKVDVIAKLPHPTTVKGIRSFLGHAGFYRRFIKDFSKIARLMIRLLEKDTSFFFSKECVEAFQTLKRKLTKAPILIFLD